ncbi:hypothetical protein B296_00029251 [Ensete ventricosum]|uniref:Uncharacterized protein n=1 Tax=Ensete ventricosum TaxID=4639 RepID=A0A426Z1W4_ENSVE|nr:hypothetical protein B296_00029251 [Ensete ventricosum]
MQFSNHDVVIVKPNKADSSSPLLGQGVVYRLKVTYRSMKNALIQLSKGIQRGPAEDLVPVLFGEKPPVVSKKAIQFSPFNKNLDHSQVFLFTVILPCKCCSWGLYFRYLECFVQATTLLPNPRTLLPLLLAFAAIAKSKFFCPDDTDS